MRNEPNPVETRAAGCCARIVREEKGRLVMAPDTPDSVPGNGQYHFLARIQPHEEELDLEIEWPRTNETHLPGFQYPDNANFGVVLQEICFQSRDRRNWHRLNETAGTGNGVRIRLGPSADPCWIAVGIPYFPHQLEALVETAASSPRCEVTEIGRSRRGRPLHGVLVKPGQPEKCRGLFLLQAYQHHSEWAGLHAMDEMLRGIGSQDLDPGDFAWAIVPCVNVDALHGGWGEDLMHRDCGLPGGGNLNRDWKRFHHPETTTVRDFFLEWAARFPVLHGLDIHMGWSNEQRSGGGLSVFIPGQLPEPAATRERAFTEQFFQLVPIEPFAWEVTQTDRPNFSAWVWRTFGAIGQTVEISRFRAYTDKGLPTDIDLEYYQRLGPCMMEALKGYYESIQTESLSIGKR